ncbi:hypothetical protein O181_003701 [Austropuccinia psidii MF-1]|uniref:Uncharacterized protein n=1 Tax=Austropuccinia psidii MF-1 TaxID=1389203 RepID=A0A9Q3BFG3_9BASI|nr:hypothetical protein [Austropuccinia psidii MF-1]
MEDTRTSTRNFENLLESLGADINVIPSFRNEYFLTGNSGDLPVSAQKLVYGSKAAGVGTSVKSLGRDHDLLSSNKGVLGPRKDRRPFEGLDTHLLQRTSPEDKALVEKPKNFVRGPEEKVGPKEGQQPSGSSASLHKQESSSKSAKKGKQAQRAIRKQRKRLRERESPSGTNLNHRSTEFK